MNNTVFNPAIYNNNKTVSDEMRRQSFLRDMAFNGMDQYRCKKIRKFPHLLGVAKDLDTPGCLTIRDINGQDDIAVYPDLTLREVINSFSAKDGVAAVNCYYVKTIKKAARILRECCR